jgi:hypothetical protein
MVNLLPLKWAKLEQTLAIYATRQPAVQSGETIVFKHSFSTGVCSRAGWLPAGSEHVYDGLNAGFAPLIVGRIAACSFVWSAELTGFGEVKTNFGISAQRCQNHLATQWLFPGDCCDVGWRIVRVFV